MAKKFTRREWLKLMGLTTAGAMLGSCAPQVVTKEVEVEKEVEVTRVVEVPAAAELAEIVGWTHWGGEDLEMAQDNVMHPFNEGPGPDMGIHFKFLSHIATGGEPEWGATYIAAFQAEQAPDLIHVSGGLLPVLQPLGILLPPPDDSQAFIRENYVPGAVEYATVEGNTYGYPTELQANFQMINNLHLQEAGLEGAPQSWEDFRDYAAALTVGEGTDKTRAGWGVPDAYAEQCFLQRLVMHKAEGEDFVDVENMTSSANSDVGKGIMELWHNMAIVDSSTSAGIWGIWDRGINNEFWSMEWFDIWNANFGIFRGPSPGPTGMTGVEYLENLLLAMLPTQSGSGQVTEARIYLWVTTSQTEHPDACWQYLKWLNGGPDYRMATFFVEQFMFPPPIIGMDFSKDFTEAQVDTQVNAFENSFGMPFVKGLFEMYEASMAEQAAVWFGEKGWEEAEEDLKEACDLILEGYAE